MRRTMPASAWMSWTAPVEVSLWVAKTTLVSGACRSAAATISGSTLLPYGTVTARTRTPYARQISAQRSPNFPPCTTMAWSPGDKVFATEPSMAPVPEAANIKTSFPHWKSVRRSRRTSAKRASYSGVR